MVRVSGLEGFVAVTAVAVPSRSSRRAAAAGPRSMLLLVRVIVRRIVKKSDSFPVPRHFADAMPQAFSNSAPLLFITLKFISNRSGRARRGERGERGRIVGDLSRPSWTGSDSGAPPSGGSRGNGGPVAINRANRLIQSRHQT